MDLAAIKTEIAKPEYDGLSDGAVADLLNAKTVTRSRLVPTWEVKKHAIENQYWSAIVMATEPGNPLAIPAESLVTVRGLAIAARDWIDDASGKISTIDFALVSVQTLVGGLVASGLVTQPQATALSALGSETVAWPKANNLPEIGIGLVANARREMQ
jgi:hypothetical protein